jgi:hypothetical protein
MEYRIDGDALADFHKPSDRPDRGGIDPEAGRGRCRAASPSRGRQSRRGRGTLARCGSRDARRPADLRRAGAIHHCRQPCAACGLNRRTKRCRPNDRMGRRRPRRRSAYDAQRGADDHRLRLRLDGGAAPTGGGRRPKERRAASARAEARRERPHRHRRGRRRRRRLVGPSEGPNRRRHMELLRAGILNPRGSLWRVLASVLADDQLWPTADVTTCVRCSSLDGTKNPMAQAAKSGKEPRRGATSCSRLDPPLSTREAPASANAPRGAPPAPGADGWPRSTAPSCTSASAARGKSCTRHAPANATLSSP